MRPTILALALAIATAAPAAAADLHVPADMMLCRTLEAAANPAAGVCWAARGGQRVEVVATLPNYAQFRIWSTDGKESMLAYGMRADADRIQESRR